MFLWTKQNEILIVFSEDIKGKYTPTDVAPHLHRYDAVWYAKRELCSTTTFIRFVLCYILCHPLKRLNSTNRMAAETFRQIVLCITHSSVELS